MLKTYNDEEVKDKFVEKLQRTEEREMGKII